MSESLAIKPGNVKVLKKAKGWREKKVWKKTNQWFLCHACESLWFFRVFKCRFDLDSPIACDCGATLVQASAVECAEAKLVFPHFKSRSKGVGHWYLDVYLSSVTWRTIRARILLRDAGSCLRCGLPARIVHHKSYDAEVLAGNNDGQLVSLCFGCHSFIEFDGKRKTNLREANARLLEAPYA